MLDLNDGINILYGDNGSGKTSFLEAIYFLSMGRSFRSQLLRYIITYNSDQFVIFARIKDEKDAVIPIGIERARNGYSHTRIDGENINTQIQFTKLLPLQLINTNSYHLLESGPKYRRQFIDWGVFHVEHSFLACWQRMRRALKQRNAVLKQGAKKEQIQLWDKELVAAGVILHELRDSYISNLIPLITELFRKLLYKTELSLEYYPGWDTSKSLQKMLAENLDQDLKFKYTTVGPQKADLRLRINSLPAQDVLSRGQQKLLIFALRLAQGLLLYKQTGKNCVYLIDDLASELDVERRRHVLNILKNINAQTFITGINRADLEDLLYEQNTLMFHVKHGEITPDT
jgi:DNA replication and repair protein RecF